MMQHVGGASAYSVEGTGASGKWSHPETVAVDRRILPLNSRTRVYGAGRYSGEYTVEDTGGKVDATKLTWYMPGRADKAFGPLLSSFSATAIDKPRPTDPQQKAEAKAEDQEARKAANPRPQ